jgi:hypothetical protein
MINLNSLVLIRSECLLNGCSGELVEARNIEDRLNAIYIVLMPDGKRLAFSPHELEEYVP